MIASLPMYDFDEVRSDTNALWTAWALQLRNLGVPAPDHLERPRSDLLGHWRTADLLLGQMCGYPYRAWLSARLSVVGTFGYRGVAQSGRGRCVVIGHRTDNRSLKGRRAPTIAVNGSDSLTGWVSFGVALRDAGIDRVGETTMTGAHVLSVAAVATQRAELASIDPVTFALLERIRPELTSQVRVVGFGPEVACPPLVTAYPELVEVLRATAHDAVKTAATGTCEALLIDRFVPGDSAGYDPVLDYAVVAADVLGEPGTEAPQSALSAPAGLSRN